MQTEKALRRALLKQGYPSWGDLLTLLGVFIVATVLGSIIVGILQKIGSVIRIEDGQLYENQEVPQDDLPVV